MVVIVRRAVRAVSSWSRRRRLLAAGAIVLALVGPSLLGVRAVRHQIVRAQACASVRQHMRERGDVVRVPGRGQRVFILGDSYASGDELPRWRLAWPFDYAQLTGNQVYVDGISATGFINGGFCGHDQYATRVSAVLAAKPDVLVIQGEGNDVAEDQALVRARAIDLLQRVRSIPEVVVIAPLSVPANPRVGSIAAALRSAAVQESRRYLPTSRWKVALGPDRSHPSAAGAEHYARYVAAAVGP